MKKASLLLLAFAPICLLAQHSVVNKGTWEAGGQIRYARSSFNPTNDPAAQAFTSDVRVFNLYPDVQYFVLEGLGIGFQMAYGTVKDLKRTDQPRSHSYAIGPKVAYYRKITPAIYPFIAARYKVERSQTGNFKQEGHGYGGSVGLLWMANPHVGLVLDAFSDKAFSPNTNNPTYHSTYKEKGIRLGLSVFFH